MRTTWLTVPALAAAIALSAARSTGEEQAADGWVKVSEGKTGQRAGMVLLAVPKLGKMLLLGGSVKGAGYVQAFDSAARSWNEFATAAPQVTGGIHPYYQSAYDPKTHRAYCLSAGPMFTFDLAGKTWKAGGLDPALEGLSWHAAAIDSAGRKLVVVGADKRPDNVGWTRTVILDLDSGKWSTLPPPDAQTVREHRRLVAATEAVINLVGRTRLAWYRDGEGVGTSAELKALAARCAALRKLPAMTRFAAEMDKVAGLVAEKKTLDALKALRGLQRRVELLADAQYPVPPSRRNSPLVFDPKNKLFVLFGGDHEDYLTNDTWLLDLSAGAWRRASPEVAPSPRAGHALVYLPACGKVALYAGYAQSSNRDYGAGPAWTIQPQQLWLYDVPADRWDLAGAWVHKRGDTSLPPPAGSFYGYAAQFFSPPALAADRNDRLVLAIPAARRSAGATWMLTVDPAKLDAAGREKLAVPRDQRLYRTKRFLASYCEVPDPPSPTGLDRLPANRWVRLPNPPRNVARGCRQRDWGTAVWDSTNEQFLLWGGGHCVRSASVVIHYSPISGRLVEGYDADEPYGANGGGGFGSSVMNRPWIPTHAYNLYAYDPKAKLIVTATGFLYDPVRMDWLRDGPMARPFRFSWGHTVIETTPHGAVAWAQSVKDGKIGLWLFDRDSGWRDLKPQGRLFSPYCDSDGMAYDSKRDRLLIGWGGGYAKRGDGSITTFDFKTKKIGKLAPANAELAHVANTREIVYVEFADWLLFGEAYTAGTGKDATAYLRIYDCEKDKYLLLDTGTHPAGRPYGQGWQYDAERRLVYVLNTRGEAWALRLDPDSARLLEKP